MKKIFIIFLTLGALGFIGFSLDFQKNSTGKACAFCQEKVLTSQEFYRSGGAIALITHKPAVNGHVLIIPERHVERFEDLSAGEISAMAEMIQKVNLAIANWNGNTGYLLLQKNGREAGQTVPHVHFHYLPRFNGESDLGFALRFLISPWLKPLTAAEMNQLTIDLRAEIERIEH
ncbi:MAG: HIT family protein [Chlamydiota bacterium]